MDKKASRSIVHYDETAPRRERYRVLVNPQSQEPEQWEREASFPTEREAMAFSRGFYRGELNTGARF